MKKLPIEITDFKEIINNDYYFIDKTSFIEEAMHHGKVKILTRPIGFGKSLNLSMLKYFFDIENAEENRKLFNGLYIEKSEDFSKQGKYPVISLSLNSIIGRDYDELLNNLKLLFSSLFSNIYDNLKDLSEHAQSICLKYINKEIDIVKIEYGLYYLTEILHNYYNQRVIVLIDDYDAPIINAGKYGYFKEVIRFFDCVYNIALKGNDYLNLAVMTGKIEVAFAGIFSGFNNYDINDIFSSSFSNCFGFQQDEVVNILNEFQLENKRDAVKEWYGGYNICKVEVYNPRSIISFIKYKEFRSYYLDELYNNLLTFFCMKQMNQFILYMKVLF